MPGLPTHLVRKVNVGTVDYAHSARFFVIFHVVVPAVDHRWRHIILLVLVVLVTVFLYLLI